MKKAVDAYRAAAAKLFQANEVECRTYIVDPTEDTGQWAPDALAIIYLEPDMRQKEDEGIIPNSLSYYEPDGFENGIKLGQEAGIGFVEYINAAVAAVYE
jgi:hypothetical protein